MDEQKSGSQERKSEVMDKIGEIFRTVNHLEAKLQPILRDVPDSAKAVEASSTPMLGQLDNLQIKLNDLLERIVV